VGICEGQLTSTGPGRQISEAVGDMGLETFATVLKATSVALVET
jgi:hypothetical protein